MICGKCADKQSGLIQFGTGMPAGCSGAGTDIDTIDGLDRYRLSWAEFTTLAEQTDNLSWIPDEIGLFLGQRKRPYVFITASPTVHVHGTADNAIGKVVVRDTVTGAQESIRGTHRGVNINASDKENAVNSGGSFPIQPSRVAVAMIDGYKYTHVHVYVHPENAPPAPEPECDDLTPMQVTVLGALNGLTSRGRKDFWRRNHIPKSVVDGVTQELADKGLVTICKNGAVRMRKEGKRANDDIRREGIRGVDMRKWSDAHDWRTGKFAPDSEAAEIISEYSQ